MLSRTAEYLYWISRYMERAETNARLLDVGYRMSLFPNPNGYNNEWESVLAAAGAIQGYKNKYNIIEQKKVEDYLFFDEDNPSSVFNCILNARSNALVVRTSFTPESWLAINKTYQEILKLKNNNFNASDLPNLTEWTIEQVNLFRGSLSSLLRNDGYNFLYLGLFVERADNSARLLDVKYFVLLPKPEYIGSNIDNMQWSILLRSLSSFRAFRWAYDGEITATSEEATYDVTNKIVKMTGNIHVKDGGNIVTCDELILDLEKSTSIMKSNSLNKVKARILNNNLVLE